MNKKTFIHVGLQKTASTFLQNKFFKEHPDISFPGKFRGEDSNHWYLKHLARKYNFEYNEQQVISAINKDIANASHDTIVFSLEHLTGGPLYYSSFRDRSLARLAKIFTDSSIIIVLRRQDDFILSLYKMHVARGLNFKLSEILDLKSSFHSIKPEKIYGPMLYYDLLISELYDYWGKDRVSVLLFEDFVNSKEMFFSELCTFLDVPFFMPSIKKRMNPSSKLNPMFKLKLYLNKIFSSNLNPNMILPYMPMGVLKFGNKFPGALPENVYREEIKAIKKFYKESNKKLSQMLNRDLSELDYY